MTYNVLKIEQLMTLNQFQKRRMNVFDVSWQWYLQSTENSIQSAKYRTANTAKQV